LIGRREPLSGAVRFDRVGEEDAGAQQAKQGGCVKHGTLN